MTEAVASGAPAPRNGLFRLAAYGSPIEVTFGDFGGDRRFSGRAAVVEENGGRTLQLTIRKLAEGKYLAKLVKKESLAIGSYPQNAQSVDLGALAKGKKSVPISKEIDVWLYRSVAIIDKKTGRIVAFTNLRSAQETSKPQAI